MGKNAEKLVYLAVFSFTFFCAQQILYMPAMNQKQLAAATFGGVGRLDSTLYVVPVSITTILFGFAADDADRRLLYLAASVLILGFTQLAVPHAWSYGIAALLRVLTGAAEGAIQPICVTVITSLFVKHTSKAMGVYNWAIYLAYSSAIVLNKITQDKFWWSYYSLGCLCFLCFVSILILELSRRKKSAKSSAYSKGEKVNPQAPALEELKKNLLEILNIAKRNETLLMLIGALCRHTAGFTFGYNQVDYFKNERKFEEAESYLPFAPIVAGVSGSFLGGLLTDAIQKNERLAGPRAGLLVLFLSQFVGGPLMAVVLTVDSPYCFYLLYLAYMIIEMWFGIFLVCYSSFFPSRIQGQAIGYTIFILRLVCQNSAAFISLLRQVLSFHSAMLIMVPGLQLISAILFLTSFCILPRPSPTNPDKKRRTSF
ncbi:Oidioi.mRNA.OKI2018_I69.XSR.g13754.t1.cds [Oikopleura dioica]|uniref:Oidioi.mRNA.OKI2018_I69.XSR.g13754.t1.cds n=1 Tax=Oikopleura dioica TaxID=34765 RepID=A0ABN7S899_OIKDI|nr:Oidioi.mRNA.OKI2018_I69.XSR.g13754.t1.cds [Oikopleura dioica]